MGAANIKINSDALKTAKRLAQKDNEGLAMDNTNPPISSDEALEAAKVLLNTMRYHIEESGCFYLADDNFKILEQALSRPAAPLPEVGEDYEDIAQQLYAIGWRSPCDAQWDGLKKWWENKNFYGECSSKQVEPACSRGAVANTVTHPIPALNPQPALKQEVEGLEDALKHVKPFIDRSYYTNKPSDVMMDAAKLEKVYDAARLYAAQATAEGWRDISTAPKDGTEFFAWVCYHDDKIGQLETRCRYNEDGAFQIWMRVDYDQEDFDTLSHARPTDWQPLPTPPADTQGRG
jgi:hypothetical protein